MELKEIAHDGLPGQSGEWGRGKFGVGSVPGTSGETASASEPDPALRPHCRGFASL